MPYDFEHDSPVIKESIISYYEIPSIPIRHQLSLQDTILDYDNNMFMSLAGITDQEVDFFEVQEEEISFITAIDGSLLEFIIVLNSDYLEINRSAYNFFQVLGDVGGFYGMLVGLASTLLGWITYGKADNYVATSLYKVSGERQDDSEQAQNSLKACLQSCLPSFCFKVCSCLKPNRRDRYFEKARDKLGDELKVCYILRQLRLQ